jgi:hypothetical protein
LSSPIKLATIQNHRTQIARKLSGLRAIFLLMQIRTSCAFSADSVILFGDKQTLQGGIDMSKKI